MFESYKPRIDRLIGQFVKEDLGEQSRLQDACAHALTGGKRIRPAITLMVAEKLGNEDASGAALAIELMHTSSLIADDLPCMDDDATRRGRPTVHKAFDDSTAVLAVFALIAAGYRQLARNAKERPEIGLLAIENVSTNGGIQGLVGGQYLDLHPEGEDYLEMMRRKTGALFESAFVIGWLYGGGDLELLPKVKEMAHHFGLAFQLRDDFDDREQDEMNAVDVFGEVIAYELLEREEVLFQKQMGALL